ncbi:hypothetical protein FHW83_001967 [Duganella sp. SG902]|nr:hypothetical protein [Duganella sp. SG902]
MRLAYVKRDMLTMMGERVRRADSNAAKLRPVIPAQAGIHAELMTTRPMDSRLRGNDLAAAGENRTVERRSDYCFFMVILNWVTHLSFTYISLKAS